MNCKDMMQIPELTKSYLDLYSALSDENTALVIMDKSRKTHGFILQTVCNV